MSKLNNKILIIFIIVIYLVIQNQLKIMKNKIKHFNIQVYLYF